MTFFAMSSFLSDVPLHWSILLNWLREFHSSFFWRSVSIPSNSFLCVFFFSDDPSRLFPIDLVLTRCREFFQSSVSFVHSCCRSADVSILNIIVCQAHRILVAHFQNNRTTFCKKYIFDSRWFSIQVFVITYRLFYNHF